MTKGEVKKIDPIRETTPEAVRLGKTLVREAGFGSLAVLDPANGAPGVSRVAVAPDSEGNPVILVSQLSAHTKALLQDPRCSILLGEPGKGDPLAHPRISVSCRAEFLDRSAPDTVLASARFLRRNPKAKLYAGFADFSFVRLVPASASLNGGFGQAFVLQPEDILSPSTSGRGFAGEEAAILDRLNGRHQEMLDKIASESLCKLVSGCAAASLDSEGLEIASGGDFHRIWFGQTISTQDKLFDLLLNLRKNA